MIKVENLEAGFDGVKVLDQLNLSFAEGEIAAIIGPSGAGKSRLMAARWMLVRLPGRRSMAPAKNSDGLSAVSSAEE